MMLCLIDVFAFRVVQAQEDLDYVQLRDRSVPEFVCIVYEQQQQEPMCLVCRQAGGRCTSNLPCVIDFNDLGHATGCHFMQYINTEELLEELDYPDET